MNHWQYFRLKKDTHKSIMSVYQIDFASSPPFFLPIPPFAILLEIKINGAKQIPPSTSDNKFLIELS